MYNLSVLQVISVMYCNVREYIGYIHVSRERDAKKHLRTFQVQALSLFLVFVSFLIPAIINFSSE